MRIVPGRLALTLAVLALPLLRPAPAAGQDLVGVATGSLIGLAAGGYVSIGIWTAKARWADDYVYAVEDVLGWESTPVAVAGAVGATLGLLDRDRLFRTTLGSAAGFFLGTGIGMTFGASAWPPPEGRWAGGVIGGAAGILVGGAVGLFWPADGDEDAEAGEAAASRGVPLTLTIRF